MNCFHRRVLRRPSGQLVCMQCGGKLDARDVPQGVMPKDANDQVWQTPPKDPPMVKA